MNQGAYLVFFDKDVPLTLDDRYISHRPVLNKTHQTLQLIIIIIMFMLSKVYGISIAMCPNMSYPSC